MRINLKKMAVLAMTTRILSTANISFAYQSRPGYSALKSINVNTFFENIRRMEESGGAFGLNATIKVENDVVKETSASNNIDVHMIKNTEWGAVAMLASSDYGAGPGKVTNKYNDANYYEVKASSTHNPYGVYGLYNGLAEWEYTAGAIKSRCDQSYNKYLSKAPTRYVDSYEDSVSDNINEASKRYLPGDSTYETRYVSQGGGYFVYSGSPVFGRGYGGVLYSYGYSGYEYSLAGSRLAVWSGEDF